MNHHYYIGTGQRNEAEKWYLGAESTEHIHKNTWISFCYIKAARPAGELPDLPGAAHWVGLHLIQLWQDFVPLQVAKQGPAANSREQPLPFPPERGTDGHCSMRARSLGNCEFGELQKLSWYWYHCMSQRLISKEKERKHWPQLEHPL